MRMLSQVSVRDYLKDICYILTFLEMTPIDELCETIILNMIASGKYLRLQSNQDEEDSNTEGKQRRHIHLSSFLFGNYFIKAKFRCVDKTLIFDLLLTCP